MVYFHIQPNNKQIEFRLQTGINELFWGIQTHKSLGGQITFGGQIILFGQKYFIPLEETELVSEWQN